MNINFYFALIIRLFAIGLVVFSISKIELLLSTLVMPEGTVGPTLWYGLLNVFVPIIIAIVLWFFPFSIARKILPPSDGEGEKLSDISMLTMLIIGIGVYTLYYAIVDGFYWIMFTNIFVYDEFGVINKLITNQDKSSIAATVIELILSVILIARARMIASLASRTAR